MIKAFQNIFVDPQKHTLLKYKGEWDNERWKDGFIVSDSDRKWIVKKGIPDFIEDPSENEFGIKCRREGWIKRNWLGAEKIFNSDEKVRYFTNKITDIGGKILEIASGPGGGNVPCILQSNPESIIMMNDICFTLLENWNDFLEEKKLLNNISLAAFDARRMPIKNETFDVVSNNGGISNIGGQREALSEVYRVLKRGGYFFSCDGELVQEDLKKLPIDFINKWKNNGADNMETSMENLYLEAGFRVIEKEIMLERTLDPNEGTLPKEASEYGVSLRFRVSRQILIKP